MLTKLRDVQDQEQVKLWQMQVRRSCSPHEANDINTKTLPALQKTQREEQLRVDQNKEYKALVLQLEEETHRKQMLHMQQTHEREMELKKYDVSGQINARWNPGSLSCWSCSCLRGHFLSHTPNRTHMHTHNHVQPLRFLAQKPKKKERRRRRRARKKGGKRVQMEKRRRKEKKRRNSSKLMKV